MRSDNRKKRGSVNFRLNAVRVPESIKRRQGWPGLGATQDRQERDEKLLRPLRVLTAHLGRGRLMAGSCFIAPKKVPEPVPCSETILPPE